MAATNTETLKYLELRQRLKEKIRKEKGILSDDQSTISQEKDKKKLTDIAYEGSFFGPSQTVLAKRLIVQESKSSPENQLFAIQVLSSNKKIRALLPEALKSINGVDDTRMKKVQWLKETRDYSFLFSDDNNVPVQEIPEKESPCRNCEEEKVVQAPGSCKSNSRKQLMGSSEASKNNNGDDDTRTKAQWIKETRDYSFLFSDDNNVKVQKIPAKEPPFRNSEEEKVVQAAGSCKSTSAMTSRYGLKVQKTPAKEPTLRNSKEKKIVQAAGSCKSATAAAKPTQKQLMISRNGLQELPAKKVAAPMKKKRQVRRECEHDMDDYEGEKALSIIRKMFNTKRFCDRDDSDMNMETSFRDQMKEESRSERLARKEDEEQLRLIKEEEEKKFVKKRKLGYN